MSCHGRNILGATFRRTTGITYSSIAARPQLRHSLFPVPSTSCASPQVSAPITHEILFASTFSKSQKTTPQEKSIRDPFHHAVTSTTNRLPELSLSVFHGLKFRIQGTQRLRVALQRQTSQIKGFRGQCFNQRYLNSQRRCYSHKPAGLNRKSLEKGAVQRASESSKASSGPTVGKHLIDRLPNLTQVHRPNKEELLAAATGFWSRLKVRFKWFSIRSGRPFNIDEISAFFSWVLLGHVLWIVLGTTTFFSLAILAVNTVFAQGRFHLILSLRVN